LTTSSSLEAPSGSTGLPTIDPSNSRLIVVDAADLSGGNDIYRDNPSLLDRYKLEVGGEQSAIVSAEYTDVDAEYGNASTLRLYVSSEASALPLIGTASIIPRYFAVSTSGVEDSLPDSASVSIEFQATTLSSLGTPDVSDVKPAPGIWATDMNSLNYFGNSELQFIRFRVRFDIGVGTELSANTPRPTLEFLKVPFTF